MCYAKQATSALKKSSAPALSAACLSLTNLIWYTNKKKKVPANATLWMHKRQRGAWGWVNLSKGRLRAGGKAMILLIPLDYRGVSEGEGGRGGIKVNTNTPHLSIFHGPPDQRWNLWRCRNTESLLALSVINVCWLVPRQVELYAWTAGFEVFLVCETSLWFQSLNSHFFFFLYVLFTYLFFFLFFFLSNWCNK